MMRLKRFGFLDWFWTCGKPGREMDCRTLVARMNSKLPLWICTCMIPDELRLNTPARRTKWTNAPEMDRILAREKKKVPRPARSERARSSSEEIRIDLSASSTADCMYECNGNFRTFRTFDVGPFSLLNSSDDGIKSESSGSVNSRDMLRIAIPLLHPRT